MAAQIITAAFATDSDVEADLEVDQLDSDSDELPSTEAANNDDVMAGPGSTKLVERLPGYSLLPASRVENMIQVDGVTGSMTLSKEALFVLSIAAEDFIKSFIQAGHREASAHRRNQINYLDIAGATRQYQEFMFLGDTVPCPMSLIDALTLRQERERELLTDNPALAPRGLYPVWVSPTPEPDCDVSNTNGKDHSRSKNVADVNGRQPSPGMETETLESYAQRQVTSVLPSYESGTQSPPFEEPVKATSPHLPVHYPGAHSPPYRDEDPQWSPPVATISESIPESAPSFDPPPNNGRTIYTQADSS